jgi:glycogen(starch) synthase
MNVLQIGTYLYPDLVGGAEITALNLARSLSGSGDRCVSLRWRMGKSPLTAVVRANGANQLAVETWRPFGPIQRGTRVSKWLFYGLEFLSRTNTLQLKRLVKAEAIDLVLLHSFRGFGYDFLRAIADLDLPTVIYLHDYALMCMNKGRMRGEQPCLNPCMPCRAVTERNRRSLHRLSRLTFIGPSRQICELTEQALRLPKARYIHLPNPNTYSVTPRVRAHRGDKTTFGYIGRLERDKGILLLLDVMKELARRYKFHLTIAGAGSMEAQVRAFCSERSWATFHGFVPSDNVGTVFDEIDCLLLPSLWPENFPGAAVQSLLAGAPVVGFETGGIAEIIESGVCGLTVTAGSQKEFAAAVETMICEPDRILRYSEGALATGGRFAPGPLLQRLHNVLVETVSGSPALKGIRA